MTNKIHYFKQNKKGTDWFVGDIHGTFSALEKQLESRGFNESSDRLFCTGDLIDRGDESQRAIEFLEKNWFFSVLGNHDNFVLQDYNDKNVKSMWFWNGGAWWFNETTDEIKQQFIKLFTELPHIIEVETKLGKVGIVHAEVPINFSNWNDLIKDIDTWNTADSLLWGRKRLNKEIREEIENIDLVVSGHTCIIDPVRLANSVFIDNRAYLLKKFILLTEDELFDPKLTENLIYIK
jgi:serine/threonine protein phosphatase 1